ncbi:MAG: hypothetical protein ACKO5E_12360 [bacterium]
MILASARFVTKKLNPLIISGFEENGLFCGLCGEAGDSPHGADHWQGGVPAFCFTLDD